MAEYTEGIKRGHGHVSVCPSRDPHVEVGLPTARCLQVYLSSQCQKGGLQPDLYASGSGALAMGCEAGPLMTVSMGACLFLYDSCGGLTRELFWRAVVGRFCNL